jgi:alkylated DNA nucleotide flippase Atl1
MEALRQEIMRGVDNIQQGRFTTYETAAELEAFSDEIIRQGQGRQDASRNQ